MPELAGRGGKKHGRPERNAGRYMPKGGASVFHGTVFIRIMRRVGRESFMMWTRENFRTGMSGRDTVSGQGIFAKKEMLVRTVGNHP